MYVLPPSYPGTADVKVRIYTLAFRKVLEQNFPQIPLEPVALPLTDNGGSPLASGLYYVVVTVDSAGAGQASLRSVAKLLLLR